MTKEAMEQVKNNIAQLIADREYPASKVARQILSIPEILIKDPDQSLPEPVVPNCQKQIGYARGLHSGQNAMLKDNWVKVLPKEEKSNG